MSMSRKWVGLRIALAALATIAVTAGSSRADSLKSYMNYNTSGTIDSAGVTGTPVISFNSVAAGSFTAPSSFSLGEFLVSGALPDDQVTTYTNTKFSITLGISKVNGSVPLPNETPFTLTGVLNGSITGTSQSDVVATFDPVPVGTFRTGDFLNTLKVLDSNISLVPSTTNGGRTTAQAQITTTAAVPEPTSVAIFLSALAGFGMLRRSRAGR
ncbi:PEP-CTERM sorting domain-containing protein [Isosphaeraceae bacterium EP7]